MKTNWFIIQTSYRGEQHDPRLVNEHDLIMLLIGEAEAQHYFHDGNTIDYLAKYEQGNLIPLTVQTTECGYRLVDAQLHPVVEFGFQIDVDGT